MEMNRIPCGLLDQHGANAQIDEIYTSWNPCFSGHEVKSSILGAEVGIVLISILYIGVIDY
jgi:hypothetical protein